METSTCIKHGRNQLGLTQKALAEKLGTSRFNISKWERGTTKTPGQFILKLQALLHLPPNVADPAINSHADQPQS